MKGKSIARAFEKLGFTVTVTDNCHCVENGDTFAYWRTQNNDSVNAIYVSSHKAESEWPPYSDGLPGSFYQTILHATAAFLRYLYDRQIGGVKVTVKNYCKVQKGRLVYMATVDMTREGGGAKGFSVQDANDVAFLRSGPPDEILLDWIKEHCDFL